MLRGAGLRVKPGIRQRVWHANGFAGSGRLVQTGAMTARRLSLMLALACLAAGTALGIFAPEWRALRLGLLGTGFLVATGLFALAWRERRRVLARRDAIVAVMDAADALEARLRDARGELEAVAGDHENPVRGAMQDLLRQRLWLQQHAQQASLAQLDGVRRALDDARLQLEGQLGLIARARAGA
jgi:hypothetical protein